MVAVYGSPASRVLAKPPSALPWRTTSARGESPPMAWTETTSGQVRGWASQRNYCHGTVCESAASGRSCCVLRSVHWLHCRAPILFVPQHKLVVN